MQIVGIWLLSFMPLLTGCDSGRRNLADFFLLHPVNPSRDMTGATRRIVRASNLDIDVWVMRSPPARSSGVPKAFVLEFTGNGNSAQEIIAWVANGIWKDRPVEVWAVNYPGFGGSGGVAKVAHVAPVALAAYDELRRVAGDRPIFVSGASFGGMTSLFVASRRPVAGVLTMNPPPLRDIILREHGWWNLWTLATWVALEVPPELDAVANAASCAAPLFAVVSVNDEVVPARLQQRIYDHYAGPTTIVRMPHGTHGSNFTPEATAARQRWLDNVWSRTVRGG
jgi:pimeloyl-ACP methyl ester carboxylesterase